MALIDDANQYLDAFVTGTKNLASVYGDIQSIKLQTTQSKDALASAEAQSRAATSIAQINAQASVDAAKAAAAKQAVDFSKIGPAIVQGATDYWKEIAIGSAALLGLILIMQGRK